MGEGRKKRASHLLTRLSIPVVYFESYSHPVRTCDRRRWGKAGKRQGYPASYVCTPSRKSNSIEAEVSCRGRIPRGGRMRTLMSSFVISSPTCDRVPACSYDQSFFSGPTPPQHDFGTVHAILNAASLVHVSFMPTDPSVDPFQTMGSFLGLRRATQMSSFFALPGLAFLSWYNKQIRIQGVNLTSSQC